MSQTGVTKAEKKAKKNEARDTIVVIIEALVIALVFRTFLYQPFSIPTASMQSTLMIGDYFVANKWAWASASIPSRCRCRSAGSKSNSRSRLPCRGK